MTSDAMKKGHNRDYLTDISIFFRDSKGFIGDSKGTYPKIDLSLMLYSFITIQGLKGLIYIRSNTYLYLYAYMLYICSITPLKEIESYVSLVSLNLNLEGDCYD